MVITFACVLCFSLLLIYIKSENSALGVGIFYAVLMLVASTVESLFLQQYFHHSATMGMNLRTCIVGAIYRKVFNNILDLFKNSSLDDSCLKMLTKLLRKINM